MTYTKPEVRSLGNAAELINHFVGKTQPPNIDPLDAPAYDLDE
jgi:hypothetical protein